MKQLNFPDQLLDYLRDYYITDEEANLLELKQVGKYKYLGVMQKLTFRQTADNKQNSMIQRATIYKITILRLTSMIPDRVYVYRATWENVAIPSIVYWADVIDNRFI